MELKDQQAKISNAKAKVVGIRYIGLKPKKNSEVVPGSNIEWNGFGDVQPVPEAIAHVFLAKRYAQIWQHEDNTPPENQTDAARSERAAAVAANAVTAHKAVLARKTPVVQERAFDTVPKERIVTAIGDLAADPDSAQHFTPEGPPKLESVQKLLGKKISKPALTEAWDEIVSGGAR